MVRGDSGAEGVDLGTWWNLLGVSQLKAEGNAGSPLFKTSRLATFASHLLSQEIPALPFLHRCLGRDLGRTGYPDVV